MNTIIALICASILMVWGASTIIASLFGIRPPLFRLLLGLLMIGAGLTIAQGLVEKYDLTTLAKTYDAKTTDTYAVWHMGSKIIDTTHPTADITLYSIPILFGNTTIIIDPAQAVEIRAFSILSSITFPDRNLISVGRYSYKTAAAETKPLTFIEITAIASNVTIVEKATTELATSSDE